jgi:hypothetical protein
MGSGGPHCARPSIQASLIGEIRSLEREMGKVTDSDKDCACGAPLLSILASGRRFELGRILVSNGVWRKPRGSAPWDDGAGQTLARDELYLYCVDIAKKQQKR